MRKLILSALMLLIGGCLQTHSLGLKNINDQLWYSMLEVEEMWLAEGEQDWPPYVWRKILEVEELCLWYRSPNDQADGLLRLIRGKDCAAADYTAQGVGEVEGVRDLSLRMRKELYLEFSQRESGQVRFRFHLPNLKRLEVGEQNESRDLNSPYQTLKVYLSSLENLPRKSALEDGEFCHKVNEDCKDVLPFQCGRCPRGWYQIVDVHCSQGSSKICGRDLCGQRGEPACPRGVQHLFGEIPASLCFEGSDAGICEQGLTTSCDERGVLICL